MYNFTQQFKTCTTTAEIKKLFRDLCLTHHPDRGGETAAQQELNNAYQAALKSQTGKQETGTDGKTRTYTYNAETEEQVAAKIQELIALSLEGVEIWLIGQWVWVKGDTRPHKDALKTAGCFWNKTRNAWCWRMPEYKSRKSSASFPELAAQYGAKTWQAEERAKRPKLSPAN